MYILKAFILFGVFVGTMGCVSTVPLNGENYSCQAPISEDANHYYVVMQIHKEGKTTSGDQASTTSSGQRFLVNNSPKEIKIGAFTLHPGKSVELTADTKYLRAAKSKEFNEEILKNELYINKRSDSIWVIERILR